MFGVSSSKSSANIMFLVMFRSPPEVANILLFGLLIAKLLPTAVKSACVSSVLVSVVVYSPSNQI